VSAIGRAKSAFYETVNNYSYRFCLFSFSPMPILFLWRFFNLTWIFLTTGAKDNFMNISDERREFERSEHTVAIVYAYHNSDKFYKARMRNYCKTGMCFESACAIDPGSDIYIMMEDFLSDTASSEIYDGYLAKVLWCQQLAGVDPSLFKIGVRYYQTIINPPSPSKG
jgi:hypothetical protein